jgi:hypothetical protein
LGNGYAYLHYWKSHIRWFITITIFRFKMAARIDYFTMPCTSQWLTKPTFAFKINWTIKNRMHNEIVKKWNCNEMYLLYIQIEKLLFFPQFLSWIEKTRYIDINLDKLYELEHLSETIDHWMFYIFQPRKSESSYTCIPTCGQSAGCDLLLLKSRRTGFTAATHTTYIPIPRSLTQKALSHFNISSNKGKARKKP